MGLDRGKQTGTETNAKGGKGCAEEIHPDDGRVTYNDARDHKGDWGKQADPKQLEEGEQKTSNKT